MPFPTRDLCADIVFLPECGGHSINLQLLSQFLHKLLSVFATRNSGGIFSSQPFSPPTCLFFLFFSSMSPSQPQELAVINDGRHSAAHQQARVINSRTRGERGMTERNRRDVPTWDFTGCDVNGGERGHAGVLGKCIVEYD